MKKVPKLRFKEFTEEWEEKKLGDITNLIAGGTPSTLKKEYWNGDIKWMNSGELNLKFIQDVQGRITEIGLKSSSTRLIPKFCILIGLAGQGKTRGTVAINLIELCTNQSIAAILPNFKCFKPMFLYYNLDNRYEELRNLSTGSGGRGGLNLNILKNISCIFPALKEQEKIADFLSNIDKEISIIEKKLKLFNEYKRGIMQKIFSQELRFKDENRNDYPEWEEKKLGDISQIQTGNKDLENKTENGVYPFFVRSKNIEKIDTYSYEGEAILIPGDGKIGEVYHYINGKFDYHQRVYKISDFKGISCKYIYYYLYQNFKKHALTYTVKATVDSLRLPTIKEFIINLPYLEEQQKIVDFLSAIDTKIEKISDELEELKEFKKGLLQQMFV